MLLRRSNIFLFVGCLTGLVFLSVLYTRSPLSPEEAFANDAETDASSEFTIQPIDLGDPKNDLGDEEQPSFISDDLADSLSVTSQLKARLKAFEARPVLSYEAALERDRKLCPVAIHDRQVNKDQLNGQRENWKAMDETVIRRKRRELVAGVEALIQAGNPVVGSDLPRGRGIVVAGGNRDTTARLLTLLRILRNHLHSKLAVQIFHFSGEITDQNERRELEELGATLHQFSSAVPHLNIWKNFQIKGLAILSSTFAEVLYLDSDNIPLKDPAHLFDNKLYKDKGRAVFWPDLNRDHPENAIFRLLGEECIHKEWQIDSGQLLIDKRGNNGFNLAALHLANIMQADHEFWFKLSGGDKDTFRYAFHVLDLPFAASPRWLSSAGSLNPIDGRFCGNTMLQYDLPPHTSTPLFAHANLLKHVQHPLGLGSTFTHIKSAAEPLSLLDGARMYVYDGPGRGMCVDVENDGGEVITEEWEDVALKGFEKIFYEEGGKSGGW